MRSAGPWPVTACLALALSVGAQEHATLAPSADESAIANTKSQVADIETEARTRSASSARERAWQELTMHGVTAQVALIADLSKNFVGGACSDGAAYRHLLKASVAVDSNKAFGWKGGTAFASFYSRIGQQGHDYTGDEQGFSNIDAPSRSYLYEAWYQQELFDRKLRVKIGQVDANTEFATVENGADFLNSSMGFSPTILGFATYPQPRASVNISYQVNKNLYARAGLYSMSGAGTMPIVEGGRQWAITSRELEGRAAFGYWRRTGMIADSDGDKDAGTQGFYLVAEQAVWRQVANSNSQPLHGDEPQQSIALFWQYGKANGEVSNFTEHIGGGMNWRGPLPQRRSDVFGLGATWVRLSDEPGTEFDRGSEMAFEAFYKIHFTKFLSIGPDLQYIHWPGGVSSQADCFVATPRLTLGF